GGPDGLDRLVAESKDNREALKKQATRIDGLVKAITKREVAAREQAQQVARLLGDEGELAKWARGMAKEQGEIKAEIAGLRREIKSAQPGPGAGDREALGNPTGRVTVAIAEVRFNNGPVIARLEFRPEGPVLNVTARLAGPGVLGPGEYP